MPEINREGTYKPAEAGDAPPPRAPVLSTERAEKSFKSSYISPLLPLPPGHEEGREEQDILDTGSFVHRVLNKYPLCALLLH